MAVQRQAQNLLPQNQVKSRRIKLLIDILIILSVGCIAVVVAIIVSVVKYNNSVKSYNENTVNIADLQNSIAQSNLYKNIQFNTLSLSNFTMQIDPTSIKNSQSPVIITMNLSRLSSNNFTNAVIQNQTAFRFLFITQFDLTNNLFLNRTQARIDLYNKYLKLVFSQIDINIIRIIQINLLLNIVL